MELVSSVRKDAGLKAINELGIIDRFLLARCVRLINLFANMFFTDSKGVSI